VSGSADVARYYDSNTRRFMLAGPGGGVHAMHRELWGPGVTSSREAADYVNRLLADQIHDLFSAQTGPPGSPAILDFGCGVGGTLFHLAGRFPDARLTGVTVSQRQAGIAASLVRELGLSDRCEVRLADFHTLDSEPRADVLVAVESFAHSDGADAFLQSAARHVRPGGHVLIADDFLLLEEDRMDVTQQQVVQRFRAGWRVPAVCTAEHLLDAARRAGFAAVNTVDLSGLTRPGSRVRDRLVAAVSPLLTALRLERVPLLGNLVGGHALQVGLTRGFLRYELVVLRRVA
jgi:SAM-dependent methyltransferase